MPDNKSTAQVPAAAGAAIVILGLVAIWKIAVLIFQPAPFLLPPPEAVAKVFATKYAYLAAHSWITMVEMVLGLVAGVLAGIVVALLLANAKRLDRFLMPIVVTSQTLPVFAIAPLLVIWFGLGMGSKIVMAMLIIFFPVASAFYDGLKTTPRTYLDLARTWNASRAQTLLYARLPAALPSLASGMRIAATIAPIGAVVGEWAGASGGLGFVMLQANARVETDMVFAAVIVLAVSAYVLRYLVSLVVDRLVFWSAHA